MEQPTAIAVAEPDPSTGNRHLDNAIQSLSGVGVGNALLLLGALAALARLSFWGNRRKGKLASAGFAEKREVRSAKKQAKQQFESSKPNEVALQVGGGSKCQL